MKDKFIMTNTLKEISTYRSGKYRFSAVHDEASLYPLIMECRITEDLIRNLPIIPTLCTELNDEGLVRQYVYSTLMLEGGLINSDTVNQILNNKDKESETAKEVHAMRDAALFVIEEKVDGPLVITEETVGEINGIVAGRIKTKSPWANNYRTEPAIKNNADTGVFISPFQSPPKIRSDIKILMHEFFSWINSKEIIELDPLVRSALASFHIQLIHPFERAVGRTATLLETRVLHAAGMRFMPLMLADFYNEEKDKYFSSLKDSLNSKGDLTPYLKFALTARLESLKKTRQIITSSMRKLALRDYFMTLRGEKLLTAKQYDLVSNLLSDPRPISLTDIFKTNPYRMIYSSSCERTARRDLGKLTEMELLTPRENKSYALNMKAIGLKKIPGKRIKGRC
jgi:Fic family protein